MIKAFKMFASDRSGNGLLAWVVQGGIWNDTHYWVDTETWED